VPANQPMLSANSRMSERIKIGYYERHNGTIIITPPPPHPRQEVYLVVTDSGRTQVLEASLPAKDFLLRTLSQVQCQVSCHSLAAHSQFISTMKP
jgi:hypothetical protein